MKYVASTVEKGKYWIANATKETKAQDKEESAQR